MFRAEQMLTLKGPIRLDEEGGARRLVNESELELRDAILVESGGSDEPLERWLGTIKPGESVTIAAGAGQPPPGPVASADGPDPNPFLESLRNNWEQRAENRGELRLVAWVPTPVGGQVIEPAVDRRRGFTAVLVHVRMGSPPSPDGRLYNSLAAARAPDEPRVDMFLDPRRSSDDEAPGRSARRPRSGRPPGSRTAK
jgi:hypothetical protein